MPETTLNGRSRQREGEWAIRRAVLATRFRSQTTGALYAWELERGRRSWRVPVRGGVVTNEHLVSVALAAQGMGLAHANEPAVKEWLDDGRLRRVLEPYAAR